MNTPRITQVASVTSNTLPATGFFFSFISSSINNSFVSIPSRLIANYYLRLLHIFAIGPAQRRAVTVPPDADHFALADRHVCRRRQIVVVERKSETVTPSQQNIRGRRARGCPFFCDQS